VAVMSRDQARLSHEGDAIDAADNHICVVVVCDGILGLNLKELNDANLSV
jgi:hypothetical protein